ncbi:MAG TPA: glycosyltransferase family 2 protein [Planktothrix sp.]|jgi:hypothetical protein
MRRKLELCISVVGGGKPELTWDCLRSLVESFSRLDSVEIHFVDNAAPSDWFAGIEKLSPLIRTHRNDQRRGFAANHNAIMQSVDAEYYLLLNDDTIVHKNCCEELMAAAKRHPRVGFFGARLFNGDGSNQDSVYRFPSPRKALLDVLLLSRLFRGVEAFDDFANFSYAEERCVDFVSGAAILARGEMLAEVGFLDERYFMYSEETDWCLRARKLGWLTLFVPTAEVVHFGGQSTSDMRPERSVEFLRSHEKFISKHFGSGGLLSYRFLNLLKHTPRLAFAVISGRSPERVRTEGDSVLWSLNLLKRPGLSEANQPGCDCTSKTAKEAVLK